MIGPMLILSASVVMDSPIDLTGSKHVQVFTETTLDPQVLTIGQFGGDSTSWIIEQNQFIRVGEPTIGSDSQITITVQLDEQVSWSVGEIIPTTFSWRGSSAPISSGGPFADGLQMRFSANGAFESYRVLEQTVRSWYSLDLEVLPDLDSVSATYIMSLLRSTQAFMQDTSYVGTFESQSRTSATSNLSTIQILSLLGHDSGALAGELIGDSTWTRDCILAFSVHYRFALPDGYLRTVRRTRLSDLRVQSSPFPYAHILPELPSGPVFMRQAQDTLEYSAIGEALIYSDTLINGTVFKEGILAYVPFGTAAGPLIFGQEPSFGQWAWAAVDALMLLATLPPVSKTLGSVVTRPFRWILRSSDEVSVAVRTTEGTVRGAEEFGPEIARLPGIRNLDGLAKLGDDLASSVASGECQRQFKSPHLWQLNFPHPEGGWDGDSD